MALVLIATILSACGGDDAGSGAARASAGTTESPTATALGASSGIGGDWIVSGGLTGTAKMSGFRNLGAVTCEVATDELE